jgi:hypothetical protein
MQAKAKHHDGHEDALKKAAKNATDAWHVDPSAT